MQTREFDRRPAAAGKTSFRAFGLIALAAGIMLAAGTAAAADGATAQAQLRYKQDRAACLSGQSNQDRATCLREAGAALQAAKRGGLVGDQDAYERNRLLRCDRLTAGERDDCLRRMHGEGTVSGSVESGGTFTELRTKVPAK